MGRPVEAGIVIALLIAAGIAGFIMFCIFIAVIVMAPFGVYLF